MSQKKPKVGDKVRRKTGNGCLGLVKDVRSEITASTADAKEKGIMVTVLWDNGTFSYFGPEALDVIEA